MNSGSFSCGLKNGVYTCTARTQDAAGMFKALQDRVRIGATAMANAGFPVPEYLIGLASDGKISPSTAIGVQNLLHVFSRVAPAPPELDPILSPMTPVEHVIASVAGFADTILAYIDHVLVNNPTVMIEHAELQAQAAQQPAITTSSPLPVSGKQLAAIGIGVAALGGIGLALYGTSRRQSGASDASGFLPAGEFDESEDGGGDDGDAEPTPMPDHSTGAKEADAGAE